MGETANYPQERSVNHRAAHLVRTGIVVRRSGKRYADRGGRLTQVGQVAGGRLTLATAVFIVTAVLLSTTAAAQSAPPANPHVQGAAGGPTRHPNYDKLQMFVGDWTTVGDETTFVEKCDWFAGRFHVVCHAERRRPDGSLGRSLSILGYLPEEDVYTHYGIGSRGGNGSMRGSFEGTSLVFHGESRAGGKLIKSRATITPVAGGFTFRSHTSTDNGPWSDDGTTMYKRLR